MYIVISPQLMECLRFRSQDMVNIDSGFLRVAVGTPQLKVADCLYNSDEILQLIRKAEAEQVSLISFPELSITSVSCGDLIFNELLLSKVDEALTRLIEATKEYNIVCVVGTPILCHNRVINVSVVWTKGVVLGVVPKVSLAGDSLKSLSIANQEAPIVKNGLFSNPYFSFNVRFSSDLFVSSSSYGVDSDITVYLSSLSEVVGQSNKVRELLIADSYRSSTALLYGSPGFGESTTDHVYGGYALIADGGELLTENKLFGLTSSILISDIDLASIKALKKRQPLRTENQLSTNFEFKPQQLDRVYKQIDLYPFLVKGSARNDAYQTAIESQAQGLVQRLLHTHTQKVVIGISGGLDSTLALLVCLKAFDKLEFPRENIIGITMPGFGTTDRTYHNALVMMEKMGISTREISIKEACLLHFKDINHDSNIHDITYENSQARERTQILMDIANQESAMVIGTGDLSELALGWATYNGDHMSMYAVNAAVPKTLVQDLVEWSAYNSKDADLSKTLLDVLATPISPELTPATDSGDINQKTEDLVGPYVLHDFFLYYTLKYGHRPSMIYARAVLAFEKEFDKQVILHWLTTFYRRFFNQQFKRSCLPDGPNITGLSLSPRGGWTMASDATSTLWLAELEELKKTLN